MSRFLRSLISWLPIRDMQPTDFAPEATAEPAGVQVHVDCLAIPGAKGLYDCNGQPIRETFLRRGSERHEEFDSGTPQPIAPLSDQPDVEERSEVAFVASSQLDHFGHMLTETAGWLWPFLEPGTTSLVAADPQLPILLASHSLDRALDTVTPVAQLLGLPRERILTMDSLPRPLLCRRVHVPVPSMINRRWIADHHFAAVRHLVDRFCQIDPTTAAACIETSRSSSTTDKVYLSRSQLTTDLRQLHDEKSLERELQSRGWQVYYPEQHPITDQLMTLARARVIAGEAGSAFHLLMYFGRQMSRKTVILLGVAAPQRDPRVFTFVSQLRRQPVDFHYLCCLGFCPGRTVIDATGAPVTVFDRRFLASPRATAARMDRIRKGVRTLFGLCPRRGAFKPARRKES